MPPWFQILEDIHGYIWPLVIIGLYLLDRRLRALETTQEAVNCKLDLLLESHHLANGGKHGVIRLPTD